MNKMDIQYEKTDDKNNNVIIDVAFGNRIDAKIVRK